MRVWAVVGRLAVPSSHPHIRTSIIDYGFQKSFTTTAAVIGHATCGIRMPERIRFRCAVVVAVVVVGGSGSGGGSGDVSWIDQVSVYVRKDERSDPGQECIGGMTENKCAVKNEKTRMENWIGLGRSRTPPPTTITITTTTTTTIMIIKAPPVPP